MLNVELIERLKSHWSARGVEIIAKECIHYPALFRDLLEIMFEGSPRAQQQSAWAIAKITDTHAFLFHPYTRRLIDHILHPGHSSVTRNTLRIWMKDLPDEVFHGEITDICFTIVMDRNQLPASRAFAMHVLGRLCVLYPDLWNELKSIIEAGMPVESPAFCSVGRNLLKKFSRRN